MIKFENYEVVGWQHAIRGMRNPMNSWDKSDSDYGCTKLSCVECPASGNYDECNKVFAGSGYIVGPNDHDLMMRLRNAGSDHRKYMRQIIVYVDITAPLYWWKEFDTYKVGTVANSCSTMHKIHAKEFTLDDFSCEHLMNAVMDPTNEEITNPRYMLEDIIWTLNACRNNFLETKDKKYWWQMIQLLPSSYNQLRTVSMNYEVLANIYKSRKNHKLDEWRELCKWIESLPYSEVITGGETE